MTLLDDPLSATTAEISDELIFLIASAATDDQRKYATELLRYFTRKVELEAYRRGQQSMAIPQLPAPRAIATDQDPAASASTQDDPDIAVSLIPPVRWHD